MIAPVGKIAVQDANVLIDLEIAGLCGVRTGFCLKRNARSA